MAPLVVLIVSISLLLVSQTVHMQNTTEEVILNENYHIGNGSVAEVREFTSFVSWSIRGYGYALHCGGVLLDATSVLTAASCLRDKKGVRIEGDLYVLPYQRRAPTQQDIANWGIRVAKICESDEYETDLLGSDVAILGLSRPITVGPSGYALLPQKPLEYEQLAWATGYGSRYPSGFFVIENLKKLAVTRAGCYGSVTDPSVLCFEPVSGTRGKLSLGDGGGPIYIKNSNGTRTVAGIISQHATRQLIDNSDKKYFGADLYNLRFLVRELMDTCSLAPVPHSP